MSYSVSNALSNRNQNDKTDSTSSSLLSSTTSLVINNRHFYVHDLCECVSTNKQLPKILCDCDRLLLYFCFYFGFQWRWYVHFCTIDISIHRKHIFIWRQTSNGLNGRTRETHTYQMKPNNSKNWIKPKLTIASFYPHELVRSLVQLTKNPKHAFSQLNVIWLIKKIIIITIIISQTHKTSNVQNEPNEIDKKKKKPTKCV